MATDIINEISKKRTSETGHAVNVANLNIMLSRLQGYGSRYNPTNPLIKIPALQALYTSSSTSLTTIATLKPPYTIAVDIRQEIFQTMEKLSTRLINAFDSTQAVTDKMVEDTKTIIRKIRGERKIKKILNPSPDDPIQISASQQSYTQQTEHFTKLIQYIASEPTYNPNETELQNTQLATFNTQLQTANNNVITTATPYLQAISDRDKYLYTDNTGLVDIALEVKKYTKSVSTITLSEYRQISGLKFRKPAKKK